MDENQAIYQKRFSQMADYRKKVWKIIAGEYFQRFISPSDDVLDLGCGYGEFINEIRCGKKFAIDLNPDAQNHLEPGIQFFRQNSFEDWPVPPGSLDAVFTSNFLEHLPDKDSVRLTVLQAKRCLKKGGKLLAVGPNIRYLPGAYWDFWDHHTALSDESLKELLINSGFTMKVQIARFLPYTMSKGCRPPLFWVRNYLKMPLIWGMFGRQFFLSAEKI